jgi:hypothetical protein
MIIQVARVKRILHIDEEINQCSANAAFAITVATVSILRFLFRTTLADEARKCLYGILLNRH